MPEARATDRIRERLSAPLRGIRSASEWIRDRRRKVLLGLAALVLTTAFGPFFLWSIGRGLWWVGFSKIGVIESQAGSLYVRPRWFGASQAIWVDDDHVGSWDARRTGGVLARREAIIAGTGGSSRTPGVVYVFDRRGAARDTIEMFDQAVRLAIPDSAGIASDDMFVHEVHVLDHNDGECGKAVVIAHDSVWSLCRVAVVDLDACLDSSPGLRGLYGSLWHIGRLKGFAAHPHVTDADSDGRGGSPELAFWGVNNKLDAQMAKASDRKRFKKHVSVAFAMPPGEFDGDAWPDRIPHVRSASPLWYLAFHPVDDLKEDRGGVWSLDYVRHRDEDDRQQWYCRLWMQNGAEYFCIPPDGSRPFHVVAFGRSDNWVEDGKDRIPPGPYVVSPNGESAKDWTLIQMEMSGESELLPGGTRYDLPEGVPLWPSFE
jgi:hypothetical protein